MVAFSVPKKLLATYAEEHRQLDQLFLRIRSELTPESGMPSSIALLFKELVERVSFHFAHEEEGGYYSEVIEQAPRLATVAEQLQKQHAHLLSIAEQLHREIEQVPEAAVRCHPIRVNFEEFVRQCSEHEAAENQLVQDAYTLDIGSKD